ncbi:MAG: apolipoprotein N-acyltransferase [Candidatus Omnitrophica bacterium CG11_big_fil_rev_8_21_14_0_20_45_26]|uniref:Apolipoprotein N-acyltransferase n=1 Tax=Candidatus Abzuiibacterium crystallinum TaxID=1974748 RepID=A0A2H0LL46_9BACT|nr:MAG: apolipoprotein N-acyltransferase [Candidatus Omnitrophica bacterium CG11_big_fil_rev_8_21_14_0_20_45_26]PIW63788.1 MAG: apolipoprotein N-acyltransferase [Candidatus Omnitrophica bacterium CG12_big_fil_rev_8_21_14_0_65_45_16]
MPKHSSQSFLIITSAFLLTVSFPKFSFGFLAWIALVPALTALARTKSKWEAFFVFYCVGFLFFFMSLEWLRHVTYFGWVFVAALYAVFFGLFGCLAFFLLRRDRFILSLIAVPAAWVVLEWIRTEMPVWAFGWNLLGYTQSHYLPIAQTAAIFGVYGLSFLIVLCNLTIWLLTASWPQAFERQRAFWRLGYTGLLILIVMLYGLNRLNQPQHDGKVVAVGVVQANIPQSQKWDAAYRAGIIEKYRRLSEFVVYSRPDLIVWPESSWPGILNRDSERHTIFEWVKEARIPFLMGSPYEEEGAVIGRQPKIFNSAYFINENGQLLNRYDKMRLVPFGEFVPFAQFFSWFGLEKYAYSLGVGDFSPGDSPAVFQLETKSGVRHPDAARVPFSFSSLICFEDTFPSLARKMVRAGAEFLVVLTNDAWFGTSAAPYQHLQASILRAIEEGVPVVRAANTGVSGFISSKGKVLSRVENQYGFDTWVAGGLTHSILLSHPPTFYARQGHLFPMGCLAILLLIFVSLRFFPPKN